jgi:3-hydroxyisobutyrate dehydrogenase-like beta-hydroxyacid dehydrogenase
MSKSEVGIIGVGLMGHGIAMNIAKAGWPLRYLKHPGNQPTEDLDATGAHGTADCQELARLSDIVILCVTGTPQIENILLFDDRLVAALRPDTVVIDCSTAIPSSTKNIAATIQAKGGRFLDAPMTRTPREAAEGRLNLIVGGQRTTFEEMKPLFEAYAENIFYGGPVASGHKLKLLHNFVSLGFSALLCEAAACASRANIEASAFVEVLAKGGGAGVVLDRLSPFILDGDYSYFDFTISNAHKDVSYYNQMASDLGVACTVAQGVLDSYSYLIDTGHGSTKVPEQAKWLKECVDSSKIMF